MSVRRLTAEARMLPQFLVIGTQRGGTTSLYTYLSEHPQILRAVRKEVHFFDLHFDEGMKWYRAHFPLQRTAARRGKPAQTGEATPYYMFHPLAPLRIATQLPGVKLVALLRDPVARAYSHYNLSFAGGQESMTFGEAVRLERDCLDDALGGGGGIADCYGSRSHMRHSYLGRGLYSMQLRKYFELFDREDVYVGSSEALLRNPQAVYDRILDFLDLEPHELRKSRPRNIGLYGRRMLEAVDPDLLRELRTFFDPFNKDLYNLLGTDFNW